MHYHYTISGSFQRHWAEAASMYEKIMQENERINFITIVRNPRMHYLSYYYYYVQPEVQVRDGGLLHCSAPPRLLLGISGSCFGLNYWG